MNYYKQLRNMNIQRRKAQNILLLHIFQEIVTYKYVVDVPIKLSQIASANTSIAGGLSENSCYSFVDLWSQK